MAEPTVLVDVPFSPEEENDAAYIKYLRDSAYEAWLEKHPTERERKLYPFCEDCFEGHDIKQISCEAVQEMIWVDNQIAASAGMVG